MFGKEKIDGVLAVIIVNCIINSTLMFQWLKLWWEFYETERGCHVSVLGFFGCFTS